MRAGLGMYRTEFLWQGATLVLLPFLRFPCIFPTAAFLAVAISSPALTILPPALSFSCAALSQEGYIVYRGVYTAT